MFSSHPKADINYLVSSDQVQDIGVSLAMDGTALKPGLEFDTRQKRIIGLTYKVDWNYVCHNPVPKPEEIKANLITKIKLMTGLSGTTDFLEHLGILYDTFGITCKASTSQPITPEQVIQNLNTVDEYIKATAINVKETNNLKDDSTMNGPQGTVSQKTQTSIDLLLNGVKSLISKVTNVNPNYKDTIDRKTLLTITVENLHAVSHFKHETFDALQYATDFGTISKESLKRITKWGAKYFTHPSSYFPVP